MRSQVRASDFARPVEWCLNGRLKDSLQIWFDFGREKLETASSPRKTTISNLSESWAVTHRTTLLISVLTPESLTPKLIESLFPPPRPTRSIFLFLQFKSQNWGGGVVVIVSGGMVRWYDGDTLLG